MKILIMECNEDELRANRGIMDGIVDAFISVCNSFYGTYSPVSDTDDDIEEQDEEE